VAEQITNLKIRSPNRVSFGVVTIRQSLGSRMRKHEIIIKETHRALWYEDGVLVKILEAGRYEYYPGSRDFWGRKRSAVEVVLVDVRERELTIKGQESSPPTKWRSASASSCISA